MQPDDPYLGQLKNMYLRTLLGVVDILGEIPGVCSYEEASPRTVLLTLAGLTCRFVDVDTLIAAKKVAGRDRDRRTIPYLEEWKRRLTAADEGES